MPDVVVTVPKTFRRPGCDLVGLQCWASEGDPAGSPWSGQLWCFSVYGGKPNIVPGERVYIVCQDRLRGYAPLVRLEDHGNGRWGLIRGGGAVAVTIPEKIVGFRGWRRRHWEYSDETPFPEWRR